MVIYPHTCKYFKKEMNAHGTPSKLSSPGYSLTGSDILCCFSPMSSETKQLQGFEFEKHVYTVFTPYDAVVQSINNGDILYWNMKAYIVRSVIPYDVVENRYNHLEVVVEKLPTIPEGVA